MDSILLKMKKINIIWTAFLMALLLGSLVSAFGVSSPYWQGKPLRMARGETQTVNLNLQNMVGNEDVTVKAELVKGSEISDLEKDIYTVNAMTSDAVAPLKVSIPRDYEAGTREIEVEFKTIATDEGGAVTIGTGMTIAFDVVISEEIAEREFPSTIVLIVALIAIALITIVLVMKNKR